MLRQYKLLDPNTGAYERATSIDFYENETWDGRKLPSTNLTDEEEGVIQESDEEDLNKDLNLHSKRAPKHSVGARPATNTEQPTIGREVPNTTTNPTESSAQDEENTPARVQPAGGSDNQPQAVSPPAAAPAEYIGDMGQDLPQAESQDQPHATEESEGESIVSGSTLAATTGNRQS